ncbi:MAG: alpha/beta fold hydrolase [Pseudomonadales bacterium]|nr:alpha/beta fold hydrolase [Pseudomonadales bacterium]
MTQLKPPALASMFNEAFAAFELPKLLLRAPELSRLKTVNPRKIIVMPGFGADDFSTLPIRGYLSSMGHEVQGWNRGLNIKDVQETLDELVQDIEKRTRNAAEPIVIVGWSLGGYLAREVARDLPNTVEQVFTLGSPIVGGPKYTQLASLYRSQGIDVDWIERVIIEREDANELITPVTAVYSKSDGVVAWQACIDKKSPNVEHIEISASHIGLGISADSFRIVADKLKN